MNYITCLKTLGLRLPNSRMDPQKWYMIISLNLRQTYLKNNKNIKYQINNNENYDKELGVEFPSSRFY